MSVQTILAPSKIGPYKFKKTIGEGAFSVVKLSYHEELQTYFACKVVPRSSLLSLDLATRFEIEIRINQQLHHPGIVQVIDLLKDDMNYYVFMELCPNGELFKYIIERKKLREQEASLIMTQILMALEYVHSQKVAHRDLKPENLLFDPIGHLKIGDFGLSRYLGPNGLVTTPCGSPCYASPECLSGLPYDGCKSDMWSVGVILYAMVTGQLPWTKRNQNQLFDQIRRAEFTIPSFLSEYCIDLILSLMCIDTDKRFSATKALKHPWIAGNNHNYISNWISIMPIVSLKKVDTFFCENEADPNIDTDSCQDMKARSMRNLDFAIAMRLIKQPSMLPHLKNREKRHSFSMRPGAKCSSMMLPSKPLGKHIDLVKPIPVRIK